jgi:hypothetical protein
LCRHGFGGTDSALYAKAKAEGRLSELPVDHFIA